MKGWKKTLLYSLLSIFIVVVLVILGSVIYVSGIDEGIAQEKEQSNFYQSIDRQESYGCCVWFVKEGNKIIEKFNTGNQRIMFTDADAIEDVVLGPELKTLHFIYTEGDENKSFCLNIKSHVPDFSQSTDYYTQEEIEEIPPLNMPWSINDVKDSYGVTGRSMLPPHCGDDSIIYANDGEKYLIYLMFDEYWASEQNAKLVLKNINSNMTFEYGLNIEKFGNWQLSPNLNKSSTVYVDQKYSYPTQIHELKDYYLVQFGPQLLTLRKTNIFGGNSLVHSVNLPSLGSETLYQGPTCGGPGIDISSSPESNIAILITNYCEGLGYDGLIDFSDPQNFVFIDLESNEFPGGFRSNTKFDFKSDSVNITVLDYRNVTDETTYTAENFSCTEEERISAEKEHTASLQAKYPNNEVSCSFCGFQSGCFLKEEPKTYVYKSGVIL